jgi:thiamine-phosphate pyrophosphorylase
MILHLVTDRSRLVGPVPLHEARRCLLLQAQYAIDARVECIQIRERDVEARELVALISDVMRLTRGTHTRVVVNDRLDVALACRADGVHLRTDSVPVRAARTITPRGFLIGRSVHSQEDAASAKDADYLIAGMVWPSASKPKGHPVLGLEGFRSIADAVAIPVLAIGGVTVERVREVAAAGGAGVAAIGLFLDDRGETGCRAGPLSEMADTVRFRFDTSRSPS